ncbi:MAG: hypothetical protein ACK50J_07350 [Planctomyces sp.]
MILVEAGARANQIDQNVEQQCLPLHFSKLCRSPVIMHFLDLLIQLSSPPDSLPFIADIIRGVGNPKQKIQGEASGSVDQSPCNPDIDMMARACAQRLMALTCTAAILPRRFFEWCVIFQCEIEEYATSPVSDRNIWIKQGLEYFQVRPNSEEEEDLRKTLEYIWDHFGEIRGTFRQAVKLATSAIESLAPRTLEECLEFTIHSSPEASRSVVDSMVKFLQPSIAAGRVSFDLIELASRDLPRATALCYLWEMELKSRCEIMFPLNQDISAFAKLHQFHLPSDESAAFYKLGFMLQIHPAWRQEIASRGARTHAFNAIFRPVVCPRIPPHLRAIVEIDASGMFLGVCAVYDTGTKPCVSKRTEFTKLGISYQGVGPIGVVSRLVPLRDGNDDQVLSEGQAEMFEKLLKAPHFRCTDAQLYGKKSDKSERDRTRKMRNSLNDKIEILGLRVEDCTLKKKSE